MHAAEKENKVSLYNKPTAASIGQRRQTPPPQSSCVNSRTPGKQLNTISPTPTQRAQQEFFETVADFRDAVSGMASFAQQNQQHDDCMIGALEKLAQIAHQIEETTAENKEHYKRLFEEERHRTSTLEQKLDVFERQNDDGRTYCENLKEELSSVRHELDRAEDKIRRTESDAKANLLEQKLNAEEHRREMEASLRSLEVERERQLGDFKCERNAHENAMLKLQEKHAAKMEQVTAAHQTEVSDLTTQLEALRQELTDKTATFQENLDAAQKKIESATNEKEVLRQSAAEKFDNMADQLDQKDETINKLKTQLRDANAEIEEAKENAALNVDKAHALAEEAEAEATKAREECEVMQGAFDDANSQIELLQAQLAEMEHQNEQLQQAANEAAQQQLNHRSASTPTSPTQTNNPSLASSANSSMSSAPPATKQSATSSSAASSRAGARQMSLAEARQQHRRVGFSDPTQMEQLQSMAHSFKSRRQ